MDRRQVGGKEEEGAIVSDQDTNYSPLPLPADAIVCSSGELDNRNQQKMEMKVWDPDNPLTDRQIDQFLVVAR